MPDPNSSHLKVLEGRVLYQGGYFADLASNHNSHADEIVVALLIGHLYTINICLFKIKTSILKINWTQELINCSIHYLLKFIDGTKN